MKRARLKPKEERRLLRGHRWAYRTEFAQLPSLEDGAEVDVFAHGGRFVGRGFYQAAGGIAVRLVSLSQEAFDGGFFAQRIRDARLFRERLFKSEETYRWVYGESDGLPGFVADRYGSVVLAETSCAFYGVHVSELAEAFLAYNDIRGVRIETPADAYETGNVPETVDATVDGLQFTFHRAAKQKTGLFLDQRGNCRAMQRYAKDARVLDGHCYLGTWSLYAAKAGAARVLGVDTSTRAVEQARANAALNGLHETCAFDHADIMDILESGERYDLIILDPPAFAKSASHRRKAMTMYQALNAAAMNAVEPGGMLITSSCSHFVDAAALLEVLKRAQSKVRRSTWILAVNGAAPDHPVLTAMPETAYLVCVTLRVF